MLEGRDIEVIKANRCNDNCPEWTDFVEGNGGEETYTRAQWNVVVKTRQWRLDNSLYRDAPSGFSDRRFTRASSSFVAPKLSGRE